MKLKSGTICKTCGKQPGFCECRRKPHSLKRSVIRRTWTMDAPSVTDKVVIATARAYGYRGKSANTASDVLERNGYKMIPW